MTDPLQAAAKAAHDVLHGTYTFENCDKFWCKEKIPKAVDAALLAFVRAAVGCPQCDGTGGKWESGKHPTGGWLTTGDCLAEHVKLTILGEQIWADPSKCEWRCNTLGLVDKPWGCWASDKDKSLHRLHLDCGWQPRIDALFPQEEQQ